MFFLSLTDSASVVVHVVSGERPAAMQSNAAKVTPPCHVLLAIGISAYHSRAYINDIMIQFFLLFHPNFLLERLVKLRPFWDDFQIRRFVTR